MEYQRRRAGNGNSTAAVCKAVAVGMIVGLLLSLAAFYHKSKVDSLQAQLLGDISYREDTASVERHKRELAEQMQAEADTERSKLQDQLKEMAATVIEAQEAELKAKKDHQSLKEALQAAEENKEKADAIALAAAEKNSKLEQHLAMLQESNSGSKFTSSLCSSRHDPWLPNEKRDAADPELAALLKKIAKNNEVMVAISNSNLAGSDSMLELWIRNVKRSGVSNAMVVALDEDTQKYAQMEGMASMVMNIQISASQQNVGLNHAVSGLKFRILKRFLDLGYAVLLSDVDIITLQNPFQHLYRDSDVEAMSDGWDNATAYGYNDVADDPSMGWARYAHSMRVFCFNSGLFYIRPTEAATDLLKRVMHRIETEDGWDQAIFNEVIFFPSHNGYQDPSVTRRVMDMYDFMNSKVLFKQVRHDPGLRIWPPKMVHINSHPDKLPRMAAVELYYVHKNSKALAAFPDGSE